MFNRKLKALLEHQQNLNRYLLDAISEQEDNIKALTEALEEKKELLDKEAKAAKLLSEENDVLETDRDHYKLLYESLQAQFDQMNEVPYD